MSRINIRNVTKSFGETSVLKDINLDIEDGEFTVLLGASGCGKSTLLGAIAGLDGINGGVIEVDGEDVSRIEASKRGIAMVFQSYALYPTMSVYKNMSFGLKVAGLDGAEIEKRVNWAADLLQLTPLLGRRPSQLSGGQRQRVAIGRALVKQSRVCLFDEPLSNLDAKLRAETRVELKKLHKLLHQTIIYVTHDQIEALTLANRIAVMRAGRIEQYASPEEIYERPATLYVAEFIGSPAMNFIRGSYDLEDGRPVFLFGDHRLALGDYSPAHPITPGKAVVLGIRPENLSLGKAGSPTALPAALDYLEPMGSDWLATFDVAGTRLSVRLTPSQGRGLGSEAIVNFEISSASLFDAETELRL